jgi:AcrR family transcriptional regulator
VNTVHVKRSSPRRTAPAAPARTEATRERLLAAARDLFLESGPAHFSLREVARRVGLSAAAVYRHFDGKEALVAAACTEGFHLFSAYLVRALAARTPHERLVAACEQYRRFGVENPLDYRFIFMSPAEDVVKSHVEAQATEAGEAPPQHSTFRFLVDRVQECIAARVLAKDDPEKLAVVIWAHLHGLVALRLSGHLDLGAEASGDEAFAALYRDSVAHLLHGLAK